jgi:hypothetical protein
MTLWFDSTAKTTLGLGWKWDGSPKAATLAIVEVNVSKQAATVLIQIMVIEEPGCTLICLIKTTSSAIGM